MGNFITEVTTGTSSHEVCNLVIYQNNIKIRGDYFVLDLIIFLDFNFDFYSISTVIG